MLPVIAAALPAIADTVLPKLFGGKSEGGNESAGGGGAMGGISKMMGKPGNMASIISLAQLFSAGVKKRRANAMMPAAYDPMERNRASELNALRKGHYTGAIY